MKQRTFVFASTCVVAFSAAWIVAGQARQAVVDPSPSSPFTATLSNNTPLAFGMDEATAANALGVPLNIVSGRSGNEIFLAFRSYGSGFFIREDRLYLQFRSGRLTGWKGDWGRSRMWQ